MLQIPFELRLEKICEGISIYITGFVPKVVNGFTLTLLNGASCFHHCSFNIQGRN